MKAAPIHTIDQQRRLALMESLAFKVVAKETVGRQCLMDHKARRQGTLEMKIKAVRNGISIFVQLAASIAECPYPH